MDSVYKNRMTLEDAIAQFEASFGTEYKTTYSIEHIRLLVCGFRAAFPLDMKLLLTERLLKGVE